ncbi:MAG TPA: VTT domain-containing protein [Terriglobales bacterium]
MNDFLSLTTRHGYTLLFGVVFAEAIGLPLPAALALLAGGAAAASGTLSPSLALGGAILALVVGDSLLYVLGRYTGWGLLGALCRLSVHPETCILRSAESFYKRGKTTLVIAKFIPGVNTMAPPLAGSMNMRPLQFLRFDLAGACLYATAYFGLGYLFRDFLAVIMKGFAAAGHLAEIVLAIAFIGYVIYRALLYRKQRIYRVVPRVQVQELGRKLSEEKDRILLIDVRSHGYYDSGAVRIQGSLRIEPNNLPLEIKQLPKEKDVYLYCT